MERRRQKTYSHLAGARRLPSDYEIATSRLHYYVPRGGFEVDLPLGAFYAQHQRSSPLQLADWDKFVDPRATTYFKYTQLQSEKEQFVDGLFEMAEVNRSDARLDPNWRVRLEETLGPLRYLVHAFQMTAAYLGQLAPSGRITIVCAFQAADEMRRVQRIAYRMAMLRLDAPAFGAASRSIWESSPIWQPTRALVEQLLTTWDFGEVFVALNLCIKPVLDALFLQTFAEVARAHGDHLLADLSFSLGEDSRWHRDWSRALAALAVEERGENGRVMSGWASKWSELVWPTVAALAPIFDGSADPMILRAELDSFWSSCGLSGPRNRGLA